MKKTAVEWLASELRNHIDMPFKHFEELFEQAKEIEKQQIIDAYQKGLYNGSTNWGYGNDVTSEQYYDKTFKNK